MQFSCSFMFHLNNHLFFLSWTPPMSHFLDNTDPWTNDELPSTANNLKTTSKLDQLVSNLDIGDSVMNIFGQSTTSSILDSIHEPNEILSSSNSNDWGDYNSFNILNKDSGKRSTTSTTSKSVSTPKVSSSSVINTTPGILEEEGDENYEHDNDQDMNEYELGDSVHLKIWTDDEVKKFNPLTLKNSNDGLIVRVREIPEKEGLVFKHINYLISHTIKYSEEYVQNDSNNNNNNNSSSNNGETKVIRRYSDFAWLVEVLWKKYPFRLIPELPPKKFACK